MSFLASIFWSLFWSLAQFLYRAALTAGPPYVLRELLLKYAMPGNLDGSEPLDQWSIRFLAYFLPGLLGVGLLAWADTAKPSVDRLTVLALEVMAFFNSV